MKDLLSLTTPRLAVTMHVFYFRWSPEIPVRKNHTIKEVILEFKNNPCMSGWNTPERGWLDRGGPGAGGRSLTAWQKGLVAGLCCRCGQLERCLGLGWRAPTKCLVIM